MTKPAPTLPRIPLTEPHAAILLLADHLAEFGLGWRGLALKRSSGVEQFLEVSQCVQALLDQSAAFTVAGVHDWAKAAMDCADMLRLARDRARGAA